MADCYYIRAVATLVAGILTACGNPSSSSESGRVGPVAGGAAVDKPFVAFRQASLTIDRLEVPFAPPITAGSTHSPTTVASDAPDVVSIQADGTLIAHRSGRATIRALQGGGTLTVEVLAVSGLRAEPPTLRVGIGMAALPVVKSGETAIPAGAVSWYSNSPGVAMVEDGRIRAGPAKGTAVLTAVYGGDAVQVTVFVGGQVPRKK